MQVNRSLFGQAPFMGSPFHQIHNTVELHNEFDPNHVMGCSKCKKKKKRIQEREILESDNTQYPAY